MEEKVFSRPADESLEAFKAWVLNVANKFGGKDDLSEVEWIAAWQDFWRNVKAQTQD